MRNSSYTLTLLIPSSKGDVEIKRFHLLTQESVTETRAGIIEGRMVLVDGMQWVVDTGSDIATDVGDLRRLRTNRQCRYEQLGSGWHGYDAAIDPNSPYAQSIIKALYLLGYMTGATRDQMLKEARDNWAILQGQREKDQAVEQLNDMLGRGDLTIAQVRKIANDHAFAERRYKAEQQAKQEANANSGASDPALG